MLIFNVPDMTCAHCVSTVTKAIQAVDHDAKVSVDLPAKRVTIESQTEAAKFLSALDEADYPATAN